jgi:hypothetical protein
VPETTTLLEKVLFPAKVCVPVVTTPALLPSAGAKFNTPEVMLAPLAVEEPAMVPTELIPLLGIVAQLAVPEPFVVKNCPLVPEVLGKVIVPLRMVPEVMRLPLTSNFSEGIAVPIPTFPPLLKRLLLFVTQLFPFQ